MTSGASPSLYKEEAVIITCPACKSPNVSATEFTLDWEWKGKRFSDQIKECLTDGTYGIEKCPTCGHDTTSCKKYGGRCESEKCRVERMPKDRPRHFYCYCRVPGCIGTFVHDWYPGREDGEVKD